MGAFGDTLKPYQYYEMLKYGGQATPGLSADCILKVASTVAQEMGGMSFGQASSSLSQAIIGNVMRHAALKRFAELGLVDKDDLEYLTTGEVKRLKEGRHIKGWQVAQRDPYAWVQEYLLPALKKAGITEREAILGQIPQLFQNRMAAQLVGIYTTQIQRITKDISMLEKAKGLEAADIYRAKDIGVQVEGFKNAFWNTTTTLGEKILGNTGALNAVTDALNDFNVKLSGAKPGPGNG